MSRLSARSFVQAPTKLKEMTRLFRSPLSLRIVSSIFASLVVIEGVLLIPSVNRRKQEILSQLEEVSAGKVGWIIMTYPSAAGEELLFHLRQLKQDPMLQVILGGAVYRSDGTLIGQFGEPPVMAFAEARQTSQLYLSTDQGSRYDVSWVAEQSNGDEYVLLLRHNADGTQAALIWYILRIAGLVLVISAFITLVMMIFLSRQLITPILTLRRDLANAGESILMDQPVPRFDSCATPRRDELGEVAGTFEQMYEQIWQAIYARKQAEADLRQHNEQMQLYLQQVDRVTAAATEVDRGTFEPDSLDEVAARPDELGQLARMFQTMATHVKQREGALKQQLMELSIEIDQTKRQQQVAQITKSDYFQELQSELEFYQPDQFWNQD
ncbi:HAMP domain-containing protein [Egbenema bharatensis]|uniref:HAMP domain-containing protein n=1 Tax=Egbenema bharatensis TaxID=3463334 RepID=UPI003A86EFAB